MEESELTDSGPSTMGPKSVVDAGAQSFVSLEDSTIDMGQGRYVELQTRNVELEEENRHLNERLVQTTQSSELESVIDAEREKIKSLESANQVLLHDLHDARQKVTDKQSKLEKLENDVRQLEGKLSNEKQDKEDAQKDLEAEKRDREELKKKLDDLEAKRRIEAEEHAASMQETDGLGTARDDLARKHEEQRLKIAELEGAKTRAEEEADKWKQQVEEVTTAKAKLEEKLKELKKRGGVPHLSGERLQQFFRNLSLTESRQSAEAFRSTFSSLTHAQFDPTKRPADIITEVVNHWTSIHSVRELEVHLGVEPSKATPKNSKEVKERVTEMLNGFFHNSEIPQKKKMKAFNRILRVLRINVKDNLLSDKQDTWWNRNLERLANELPDLNNFVWYFIEFGIFNQSHAEQILDMGGDSSVVELEQNTRFLFIVRGFGKRGTQVLGESFKRQGREDLYDDIKEMFGEAKYPEESAEERRHATQLDAPSPDEERLRDQLEEAERQVNKLKEQLGKQKDETRKAKDEKEEAHLKIVDVRKERKDAVARATRVEEQLRQSQAGGREDDKYKEIADKLEKERQKLKAMLDDTKEKAAMVKLELTAKKDELQAKEQELTSQKEMVEQQGNVLREKGKKEDQLRAQLEQMKKDLAKAHSFSNTPGRAAEESDVVAAKEHYKKQAGELKAKNDKLQKEVKELKTKCAKLNENVTTMTKQVKILKAEIAGKEAQIRALQGEEGAAAALAPDASRKPRTKEEEDGLADMVAKVDKKLHKKP